MNPFKPLLVCAALAFGVSACNFAPLNVKFVEPKIAAFKGHGNRVSVAEGSLDGDLLAIAILKNGKFALASSAPVAPEPAKPEAAPAPAAPAAPTPAAEGADAPADATAAAAAAEPAAEASDGVDYTFRVATITNVYNTGANSYPATYSFSVTAKTGEIIYIKALSGGDLKVELAETVGELAGLLL